MGSGHSQYAPSHDGDGVPARGSDGTKSPTVAGRERWCAGCGHANWGHYIVGGCCAGGCSCDSFVEPFDCKGAALALSEVEVVLTPVRGYALFADGFTEHWWCERSGEVVDITSIPCILGYPPEYVPLSKTARLVSFCDAMVGPCSEHPACAWCEVRLALEERGKVRVRLGVLGLRLVVDRLMADNARLRAELAASKGGAA